MQAANIARGLAWFGIGLGLAEVLAPRTIAQAAGLRGHEGLIRVFGLREIASGALILGASEPQRWLWTRVAGDILDAMLLGEGLQAGGSRRRRAVLATAAVAPVVALDVLFAAGMPAPGATSGPAHPHEAAT